MSINNGFRILTVNGRIEKWAFFSVFCVWGWGGVKWGIGETVKMLLAMTSRMF